MANRYWVGGSATWTPSGTTPWSATSGGTGGASAPVAADAVIFDQATSDTITISGVISCLSITVSSPVTFAGTAISLTVATGMNLTNGTVWGSTGNLNFTSTITNNSIITNGTRIDCTVNFTGAGASWLLGGALTTLNTASTTLTSGTIDLNGFDITTGTFISSNTNVRGIIFGTNRIYLTTPTASQVNVSMATLTNFTPSGEGGFSVVLAQVVGRTFTSGTTGGSITTAPNLYITSSGGQAPIFTTGSWWNILDFTGSNPNNPNTTTQNIVTKLVLPLNANFLTSQTWTFKGNNSTIVTNGQVIRGTVRFDTGAGNSFLCTEAYFFGNASLSGVVNLDSGGINLNGFNQSSASFFSNNTNVRSIAFGANTWASLGSSAGNTTIDFATATNFTWTGTGGFYWGNTGTLTFNMGSTAGGNATMAPNLTLTSGGAAGYQPTFGANSWVNNFNHGTSIGTILGGPINIVGNLTLSPNTTYSTTSTLFVAKGTSPQTWTSPVAPGSGGPGATVDATTVTFSGGWSALLIQSGGTAKFDPANLPIVTTITLTQGTLDITDIYLKCGRLDSDNSNVRSIIFGTTGALETGPFGGIRNSVGMANATNFTYTGTGQIVGCTSTTAGETASFIFGTTGGATASNVMNLNLAGTRGSNASTTSTSIPANSNWNNVVATGTSTVLSGINPFIWGSLTLGTGQPNSTFAVTMVGTGNLNTNGRTIAGLTINCPNGTTTLLSNVTATAVTTATFTLTAGTLNLNEFAIRCGIFASDNTNTRTLAFGTAGSISVEHSTAATVAISMANISGLTCTGTGGFTLGSSIGRVITIGTTTGNTTNAPNITYTAGTTAQTITTNSKIRILTFTNGATYTLATTAISCTGISLVNNATITLTGLTVTMTGAGSVNLNGRPIANFSVNMITVTDVCTLAAAVTTSAAQISVLTAGVLTLNGFILTVGRFSSSNTNTRSINFGTTNIVMSSTTASVVHLEMSDLTGFTCTKDATTPGGFQSQSSALKTFNIGNTAGGSSINAPNLFFVGSGSAVATITNGSWIDFLNFGTSAFAFANSVNVNRLVLSVGLSTYGSSTFTMVGTGSITGNSKTSGPIIINHTGTTTLTMALIIGATTSLTLTSGILNLNGFGITVGTFISTNTNTRAITFGTANITLTTTTEGATNLSMANATGFTCTGTGGFVAAMSVTRTFLVGTTGGSVTGAPNLALTSGSAIPSFGSGSWFTNLNFTGTTSVPASPILYVDTLTLATGGTYTGIVPIFTRTQTWTPQFSKQLGGIGVGAIGVTLTLEGTQTYVANAPCYVYAGTLNLGGGDRTFGSFVSTGTATRNVNFGTNNFILSNSVNGTEVLNVPDGTNFTFTGTGGFTCSVPATTEARFIYGTSDSYTNPPTDVPNLTINNGTFTYVIIPSGSWFKTLTINNISIYGESGFTNPNVYVQDIVVNSAQTNIRPFFTANKSIAFGSNTLANNLIRGFGISNGATVTVTSTGSFGTLATSAIDIQKGTLDLNGFDITIGQIYSATNNEVRSIIFGSNFITLNNNTTGIYALYIPTVSNFTLSGTGGFKSAVSGGTNYFVYGSDPSYPGSNTNCPNITFTSGSGTINFVTGSWFNKVDLGSISGTVTGGSPGINVNSMTLTTSGSFSDINFYYTFTGTGTLITNGLTLRRLTINNPGGTTTLGSAVSVTNGTAFTTLTAGTLDLNNFSFSTWLFASNNTNTRSIAFGNGNVNITNSLSGNTALDMPDATGFTYTGTGGFVGVAGYFNFGSIGGGSIINAPNLTVTTTVNAASFADNSWWKNLDFGTSIAGEDGLQNITGNLTLSPNATYTTMTASMRGTGTITNNNKIIKALILNTSGTVTLAGNLNLSLSNGTFAAYNTLTLTSGNLDLAGYTISAYGFVSGDTPSAQRTIIGNNGTIHVFGTGSPWSVTDTVNLTRSGSYTIKLNAGGNTTFAGGSGSYGKLNLVGGGIITGSNSFEDIFSLPAGLYTVKIEAGSTQIVENFNLVGNNATFRATLRSTVDGTQFTLLQTLGTVSVNYLNIRDSNVSAAFFANNTSVDVSNNKGWNFTFPSVVQAGFSGFF